MFVHVGASKSILNLMALILGKLNGFVSKIIDKNNFVFYCNNLDLLPLYPKFLYASEEKYAGI